MKYSVVLCVCTLAACSSDPQVDARNASADEVERQVAAAGGTSKFVRPGMWESTFTVEEVSMTGLAKAYAPNIDATVGRPRTERSCRTGEDAESPGAGLFTGDDKHCRYQRFTMGSGKVDAVVQCNSAGKGQTLTLQGSYSPESYQMRMAMDVPAGGGVPAGMNMKMRVDAKRVGECVGKII